MICLRCGYCCKSLSVMIVDDPDIGFVEGNLKFHAGDGNKCKHLVGDKPGEYSCAIHDKDWYDTTPCFHHTQIEFSEDECRIGAYIMDHAKSGSDELSKKN